MATPAMKLNRKEMILIAINRLSEESGKQVPYEELVLAAWKEFPQSFGLRNYSDQYPDTSDMLKRLSDLGREGFVELLGNKFFRLTEEGIKRAIDLARVIDSESALAAISDSRLGRLENSYYVSARGSRAYSHWKNGRPDVIIEFEIQRLLKFGAGSSLDERRRRREFAGNVFDKASRGGLIDAGPLQQLLAYVDERFDYLFSEDSK